MVEHLGTYIVVWTGVARCSIEHYIVIGRLVALCQKLHNFLLYNFIKFYKSGKLRKASYYVTLSWQLSAVTVTDGFARRGQKIPSRSFVMNKLFRYLAVFLCEQNFPRDAELT
jgi:hypothetical protein